jgi:predicted MFS family arabinose efflux permease
MISGMAIGSLLVSEIGPTGVFAVGAALAAATIAYTLLLLPADKAEASDTSSSRIQWSETARLLRDPQFMQIILMIGMPAKAILTGVVLFAMPLLLHAMGFAKEDIGQITMIYAGCVIISSAIAGHYADRTQSSRKLLVWGALLTAIGLLIISICAHPAIDASNLALVWKTMLIVGGSAIIGWAHGLINAPIITHITDTEIAARVGQSQTAAAYRLLERCGHMLGPIMVGQLFVIFGTTPVVLGYIGLVMAAIALAFYLITPGNKVHSRNEEYA